MTCAASAQRCAARRRRVRTAARGGFAGPEDAERAELRVGLVELTEQHRDVRRADAREPLRHVPRRRSASITRERARTIVEREAHVSLGARDRSEQRRLRARALDRPSDLRLGELTRTLHREEARRFDVRLRGERRIAPAHRPARAAQRAVERLVEERRAPPEQHRLQHVRVRQRFPSDVVATEDRTQRAVRVIEPIERELGAGTKKERGHRRRRPLDRRERLRRVPRVDQRLSLLKNVHARIIKRCARVDVRSCGRAATEELARRGNRPNQAAAY